MTETVELAIIAGVMLVVKQVLDWITVWIKNQADERRALALRQHLVEQDSNLAAATETITKSNNGLKDQMVEEVKKSALAQGKEVGREAERAEFPKGRPT